MPLLPALKVKSCCYMNKKPSSSGTHLGSKSCKSSAHLMKLTSRTTFLCRFLSQALLLLLDKSLMLMSHPFLLPQGIDVVAVIYSGWSQSPHVIVPTVCHLGRKSLQGNGELALSQNQLQSTVSSVSDMLCWVLLS